MPNSLAIVAFYRKITALRVNVTVDRTRYLSNLGGYFSAALGFSVIPVFESFTFVWYIFYGSWQNKAEKKLMTDFFMSYMFVY